MMQGKNVIRLIEMLSENMPQLKRYEVYMVFEYASHDLHGLINHPTFHLNLAQKKNLARQLLQGLEHIHFRGVLHRDLKASNILITRDGVVKLADFGLARFYDKRRQLDYTNRVITLWFRPPELLLGQTRYGGEIDIFSAGCILTELLCGETVFRNVTGTEIAQLEKIYEVLGTPNRHLYPGIVDLPWFRLIVPKYKREPTIDEIYQSKLSVKAFELVKLMFSWDPLKRPSSKEALDHAFFTEEDPLPDEGMVKLEGDFHELDYKKVRNRQKKEQAQKDKEQHHNKRAASNRSPPPKDGEEGSTGSAEPDAKKVKLDGGDAEEDPMPPPPPPPARETGLTEREEMPPPPPPVAM